MRMSRSVLGPNLAGSFVALAVAFGALAGAVPAADCAQPAWQWFIDGGAIAGATDPELLVSSLSFPTGDHDFHWSLACTPPWPCGDVAPPVTVTVLPDPVDPPGDVGDVLRAISHGDPRAARCTATFDWAGDPLAPRPVDEHYHFARGTDPSALVMVPGAEPLLDADPRRPRWRT